MQKYDIPLYITLQNITPRQTLYLGAQFDHSS